MQTYNILCLLLTLSLFSCGSSKPQNEVKWTNLTYSFRTTGLGPPNGIFYVITLENNGSGSITYNVSPGEDKNFNYSFKAGSSALKDINDALALNKAFSLDIPSIPDSQKPDGGTTKDITVIYVNPDPNLDQPPRRWIVPPYPEKKYIANLDKLYDAVESAVPSSIRKDAEKRREDLQKN